MGFERVKINNHLRVITQPCFSKDYFILSASSFLSLLMREGVLSAIYLAYLRPKPNISLRTLMILIFWLGSTEVSSIYQIYLTTSSSSLPVSCYSYDTTTEVRRWDSFQFFLIQLFWYTNSNGVCLPPSYE